ncbi:MAG: hypothetical protein FWF82_03895, partial [Oscillospiraceae bacterium]|nr:hypothetical protein [Oscillospiraceae bacterium]
DKVIVIRLNSSDFKLRLDDIQEGGAVRETSDGILYSGSLRDNGLRYAAELRVIRSIDSAEIYISAATDYAPVHPHYRSGINPIEAVNASIEKAVKKGYKAILDDHAADFSELFDRVKVDLGEESLEKKRKLQTFFNFGRYLLISSSREGSLPANLQGVWNESNTPPWCCDYHTNVNLQMNYWHSLNTNLQECFPPLTDFMESMREPGRVTAKEYYGLDTGFVLHTQTNPFGWTAPGWDFYWGWSTAATAWLMQNLWEYYEFTGDTKTLKSRIFPIMTESAEFYSRWLTLDKKHDRLVSSPSYSPEHGSVTNGNVYEQCLIEQFFSDFVKACEVLGVESELYHKVKSQKSLLKPYAVGKDGRLLEWYEQEDADFDNTKVELKHRHISHLLGLYPGKSITKNTPELLNAAVKVMNDRGDESTGWSRAFKACLWARAGDGDRAYKLLSGLIGDCTYANMLSFHPPFQIDGNFGGTAALAEMLLQSHEGYIEVFPAVPKLWKNAAFSGLCARGGFVVSAEMSGGSVSKVEILSKIGGLCRVKINGQIKEIMTKSGEIVYV